MKDILEQEIKIGDIVAHGQRSGNSGCISIKLVTDMRTQKVSSWRDDPEEVEEVKVIGYRTRSGIYNNKTKKWERVPEFMEMNERGGWTTPDVLIVINDSVPNNIKEFLKKQVQ